MEVKQPNQRTTKNLFKNVSDIQLIKELNRRGVFLIGLRKTKV